jgi:hypothetical protein
VVIAVVGKLINLKAYGTDTVSNSEAAKRRRNELWQNLNRYIRENGGAVVSIPGLSPLRIEISKNSNLPTQLSNAGYQCHQAGRTSRIGGDPKNPFEQVDVVEVDLPKVY